MITQVERLTGNFFPDRFDFKVHVILIVLANSLDFRGGGERRREAWRGREQERGKQRRPSPAGELRAVQSSEIIVNADNSRTLPARCHGRHVNAILRTLFLLHFGFMLALPQRTQAILFMQLPAALQSKVGLSGRSSAGSWGRRCGDTDTAGILPAALMNSLLSIFSCIRLNSHRHRLPQI